MNIYNDWSFPAEPDRFIYKRIDDKEGLVWLVPINSIEPGARVHVHNPKDVNSQGYGGSTLHFVLESGETYTAKGPWHTNSHALFNATGYDVRDKHLTCVAIGLTKTSEFMGIKDIVYKERDPILGLYDRYKQIGQEWADKLGHPVRVIMRSRGGGSGSSFKPESWTREMETNYWKTYEQSK